MKGCGIQMEEIWKDIYFIENNIKYDYRGLYQVSNFGRVKSLERCYYSGKNHNIKKNIKEFILKQRLRSNYPAVTLLLYGKQKTFSVHRLVAHMFCDGYFNGAEVDHINTIKDDNRAENLRWVTCKENCNNKLTKQHKSNSMKGKNSGKNNYWYGKKRPEHSKRMRGENNPFYNNKHSEESLEKMKKHRDKIYNNVPVVQLINNEIENIWKSRTIASKILKISRHGISDCCNKKQKTCGKDIYGNKFEWRNIDDISDDDLIKYLTKLIINYY